MCEEKSKDIVRELLAITVRCGIMPHATAASSPIPPSSLTEP